MQNSECRIQNGFTPLTLRSQGEKKRGVRNAERGTASLRYTTLTRKKIKISIRLSGAKRNEVVSNSLDFSCAEGAFSVPLGTFTALRTSYSSSCNNIAVMV